MLDTDVHEGLRLKVGGRGIGQYLSQLARPHVISGSLVEQYKAQAADREAAVDAHVFVDDVIKAPNVWQL